MSRQVSLVMSFSSEEKPVIPVRRSQRIPRSEATKLLAQVSERTMTPEFNRPKLDLSPLQLTKSPRKIEEVDDIDLLGLINQNPFLQSQTPMSLNHKNIFPRPRSTNELMSIVNKTPCNENLSGKELNEIQSKTRRLYEEHLSQTYKSMQIVKEFWNLSPVNPPFPFEHPKLPEHEQRKTLVFDLDETLVHWNMENNSRTDLKIPVQLETGEFFLANINIRPLARECLAKASEIFEVIVFTASWQDYADAVLKVLDPYREFIEFRLYREHCTEIRGNFFKDLRILGRDLKDVAIVDNLVHSFGFELDNGIPIVSWYDDKNDRELAHLMEYFEELDKAEDVRALNRGKFKLRSFCEEYEKRNGIAKTSKVFSPYIRNRLKTRR